MKAIDLHNGLRRAVQAIHHPPTNSTCATCRRVPVARFHASLPIRAFSSSSVRCAEDEPPRTTVSDARLAGGEAGVNVSTTGGSKDASSFTAAPEIDLGDEDIDASLQATPPPPSMPLESDGQSGPKAPESLSSKRTRQSPPRASPSSQPRSIQQRPTQERGLANSSNLRIVPASPSYFTSRPNFTDHYLEISALYRRCQLLPSHNRWSSTKITWLTLAEYKTLIGDEPVAAGRYRQLIKMCARLSTINPTLMPDAVSTALQRFTKEEQPVVRLVKHQTVDSVGRAYGLGRRKAATARAWIVRGKGDVLINGRSLSQYFSRVHQRESALYALSVTERVGDYNVFGIVEGGGNTGQAEALTLAVAKALVVYEPSLKMRLKSAGCLTRDRRRVERKKPGHLKARKKPAWVKR